MRLPFSPKLRLALLWPAVAALVAAGLLLTALLPRQVASNAGRELLQASRLVEPEIRSWFAGERAGLAESAGAMARRGGVRVTLIAADGRVLADSSPPPGGVAAMDNHATRPEVAGALRDGTAISVRRSDTTGETYAYAAWTLALPRGEVIVARLAQPLPAIAAMRRDLYFTLGAAALAAATVIAAVWWWLNRRLFGPLSALIAGANTMARGDGGRLPIPDEEELATFAGAVNRLASRIEEQFSAVETQRDHLEEILASMPDGVLVTGRDGRASTANPAFRRLFGLGDQPIEGRAPAELVRQPLLVQLIEHTLRRGEPRHGDIELIGPERRALALQSSALGGGRPGGAAVAGAIVVVRDVTAIERLSEVRRDFVANVSHELKTPLAAIRAYAETLRDGAIDDAEAAPRFLQRILAQCRRLQALLDDLLTLSRLEAVGERVERQPVDLAALVRRAVEVVATATREHGVAVAVATEPVPPLSGDADALERLVLNLLDNAIKYNRPGGRVEIGLRPVGDQVEIEISDTGIGIPAEALPRIFERFYRVDKARAREEGGTGLGLAIVKHVAQAHGGRVEVESEIGRGSTFRVRLPLAPVPDPQRGSIGL